MAKKMVATKSGIKIKSDKRESFSPSDKEWIKSNRKNIEPDEFLGDGWFGNVYTIKGNDKLVVKVPLDYSMRSDIQTEARDFYKNKMSKTPLFTPMHAVSVKTSDGKTFGIVKPRVKVCNEQMRGKQYLLTDEEIKNLRQQVIELSKQGYVLKDRLQVGKDRKGRMLQFDVGLIERQSAECARNKRCMDGILDTNQRMWEKFLEKQGKLDEFPEIYDNNDRMEAALLKYGRINTRWSQRQYDN